MIAHTQPHAIYEEMAKEAKASRESAKGAWAGERKRTVEEAAARSVHNEQEKRNRSSQKALQQYQRGKRVTSESLEGRQAKRRSDSRVEGRGKGGGRDRWSGATCTISSTQNNINTDSNNTKQNILNSTKVLRASI
jgi:hypothetical protein